LNPVTVQKCEKGVKGTKFSNFLFGLVALERYVPVILIIIELLNPGRGYTILRKENFRLEGNNNSAVDRALKQ
jgi:hypothetical protein